MQDNFNIHEWQLNRAIKEINEKKLCKECGEGYMEEGQCMECGGMEEGVNDTTDFNKKAEDFINKHSYIIKAAIRFYREKPDDYEDSLIQTIYDFFSDELGEDWTTKISTPDPEDEKAFSYGWTDEKDEIFYNTLKAFLSKKNPNIKEATFTSKHDDNPELKGGQKELPDELQAKILNKENIEESKEIKLDYNFKEDELVKIIQTLKRHYGTLVGPIKAMEKTLGKTVPAFDDITQ
jgi:hypothetical protein